MAPATTTNTATGGERKVTMTSIQTTQAVKFHGWTLPAGATVTVESVRLPIREFGQQVATATCQAPEFSEYGFAVPVTHLPKIVGVPVYRYDDSTGRDILV